MSETTNKNLSITSQANDDIGKATVSGESDISILGSEKAQEFSDTIGFISDGKAITKEYDNPSDPISFVKPPEENFHSIVQYLARPTLVKTTTWAQDSTELTCDVMWELTKNKKFQIFKQKLAGFYGFNATANFKVTVNAQPFHSGIFQISFLPFRTTLTEYTKEDYTTNLTEIQKHTYCSGFPSVYLNLATQSEATLSVPYCGPTPFINLANKHNDFGRFYVRSLCALRDSTNSPKIDMSIYLYFTDVKLFGSTILTKEGPIHDFSSEKAITQIEKASKRVPQNRAGETTLNIVTNTGPGRGKISEGLRTLVGEIPGIGNWLQKGYDWLGLSKPINPQSSQFVTPCPSGNLVTYDSNAPAYKMAGKSGQNTTIDQLGIEKDDEMEISTFVAKPMFLKNFSWKTSDAPASLLFSLPVEPQCHTHTDIRALPTIVPTRLRYLANCFRYWRGTIKYTIYVSATKFHTGRLRLVYNIGGDPGSAADDYSYAFNQVLDIRDGMAFTVECPYFGDTPWRTVPQYYDVSKDQFVQSSTDATLLIDHTPCFLQFYVENSLKSGGQASELVELAVFQHGGSDFQVAVQMAPTCVPYPANYIPPKPEKAIPQIETGAEQNDIQTISMVNSDAQFKFQSELACKQTIGEEINSIREILKRFYPLEVRTHNKKGAFLLFPFLFRKGVYDENTKSHDIQGDTIAYFMEAYAFWRGGIRYNVQIPDSVVRVSWIPSGLNFGWSQKLNFPSSLSPVSIHPKEGDIALNTIINYTPTSNMQIVDTKVTGSAMFEFPFYSAHTKCLVERQDFDTMARHEERVMDGLTPAGVAAVYVSPKDNDTSYTLSRAVADDFTLGYLIGPPPCLINVEVYTNGT